MRAADGDDHKISIHTSPKGGDPSACYDGSTLGNFNPHLPEGR